MFCPECEGEYRLGITHCPTCDVDLVDHPPRAVAAREPEDGEGLTTASAMADYCGFLALEDARQARDRLRQERVPSEIVLRDTTNADPSIVLREECWLRVPVDAFQRVADILGYDATDESSPDAASATVACSECGESVGEQESFCPHCGARFDE